MSVKDDEQKADEVCLYVALRDGVLFELTGPASRSAHSRERYLKHPGNKNTKGIRGDKNKNYFSSLHTPMTRCKNDPQN